MGGADARPPHAHRGAAAALRRPFLPGQSTVVRCHCQVPCGIFHDDGRIAQILEDTMTIRKAVVQIQELHKGNSLQNTHQIIRWINTKEDHATKIMTTIAEYFMAQKLKKDQLSDHDYRE